MAAKLHITHSKEHLNFIPDEYREDVKIGLLVGTGLASMTLFTLMGLHS